MIFRSDLTKFQSHRGNPSVSILATTHRTAPLNKQDPIKVKNLVAKAVTRLHADFKKREVAAVVKNLKDALRSVDWQHTLDGLALFANADISTSVSLPFRVKPRVVIDENFATRDLVYAFNRATPYRVLSLGHNTRLFDAWTTVLDEHLAKPFPLVYEGREGKRLSPRRAGANPSAIRDHDDREYFRAVSDAVEAVQKSQRLPMVVVGVERNLAFYREVTAHAEDIVGMLAGNHDKTPPHLLGKLVWPIFETGATRQRIEALVQLDEAVSAHTHASGIAQVWREATSGMCRTLLVEKSFKYPTDVSPDGMVLTPHTGGAASLDDAVDEIIERVMEKGGEVYFFGPGDLEAHQGIAAVLRR